MSNDNYNSINKLIFKYFMVGQKHLMYTFSKSYISTIEHKKKCVNLAALKFSETVDDAILVFPKTDKIKIREKNFFFWGKREIDQSSSPSVSASLNGEKV